MGPRHTFSGSDLAPSQAVGFKPVASGLPFGLGGVLLASGRQAASSRDFMPDLLPLDRSERVTLLSNISLHDLRPRFSPPS